MNVAPIRALGKGHRRRERRVRNEMKRRLRNSVKRAILENPRYTDDLMKALNDSIQYEIERYFSDWGLPQ